MWLVSARSPVPDAPYWPGPRLLGAVDAVAWPLVGIAWIASNRHAVGIVGPIAIGLAVATALVRVQVALSANHRYRFTTWPWFRVVLLIVLAAFIIKLAL